MDQGIIVLNHVSVDSNVTGFHCGQKPDATMKVIFQVQDPIFLLLFSNQKWSWDISLSFLAQECIYALTVYLLLSFFVPCLKKEMFCYRHHVHPRVLISCGSVCHSLSSSEIA